MKLATGFISLQNQFLEEFTVVKKARECYELNLTGHSGGSTKDRNAKRNVEMGERNHTSGK